MHREIEKRLWKVWKYGQIETNCSPIDRKLFHFSTDAEIQKSPQINLRAFD